MSTTSLDDFMAWNDQLAALVQAGVPLDIDLGRRATDAPVTLERINALVARRVSQGASLTQAIEADDQVVSPSYRCLVQLGLQSGDLSSALTGSNRFAASVEESWHVAALAFLYPAIVCCLAFVGIVGFCLFFVPVLESTYYSMKVPAGPGLTLLQSLRATLPYWVAVPPIALLLFVARKRIRSQPTASPVQATRLLNLVPGMSRAIFQQRSANFADALAALLESGTPLPDALLLAAEAWNDPALRDATRSLAAVGQSFPSATNSSVDPSRSSHLASRFPPFLRWALLHSEATTGRVRALRMAAGIYRDSAKLRQQRLRLLAPIVVAVVLGGGVTLLYGLALFVPLVEMLRGLAVP